MSDLGELVARFGARLPSDFVADIRTRGERTLLNGAVETRHGRYPISLLFGGCGAKSLEGNYRVPGYPKLFAIGEDFGGNLWVISLRQRDSGSVLFWDRDTSEQTHVATSYTEFLGLLREEADYVPARARSTIPEALVTLKVYGALDGERAERVVAFIESGFRAVGYDQEDDEWVFLILKEHWSQLEQHIGELARFEGVRRVLAVRGNWAIGEDSPLGDAIVDLK